MDLGVMVIFPCHQGYDVHVAEHITISQWTEATIEPDHDSQEAEQRG